MAKVIQEVLECDRCGQPAERYSMAFPDGRVYHMDRCPHHAQKIETFIGNEPGEWKVDSQMKRYHKHDLADLVQEYGS